MCDACYGGNPAEQVKSAKEWELRTFGRNAVTDEDYHEFYGMKIGTPKHKKRKEGRLIN